MQKFDFCTKKRLHWLLNRRSLKGKCTMEIVTRDLESVHQASDGVRKSLVILSRTRGNRMP